MSADAERRRRGQSELVGLVLVFGMVLFGAVAVVTLGAGALGESAAALDVQRAETAMTQFDSKSALVALGNTDTQTVAIPRGGGEQVTVDDSAGELAIRIRSLSGGPDRSASWTLGTLTYANDETRIAYQGGGVWRTTRESNDSVMVSPPEFHFRNGTLTLPVISVSGDEAVGRRARINAGSPTTTWHPDPGSGWPNPLDDHKVFVNVTSQYYKGWGAYFEARTDGRVRYDHANREVSLELVTPIGTRRVTDAVASLAPTGSFHLRGTSSDPCSAGAGGPPAIRPYANSYNSSNTNAGYCAQHPASTGSAGNITYGDTINIATGSGGSAIEGHLRSGGSVEVAPGAGAGQPFVDGNIYYTSSCDPNVAQCDSRSTGSPIPIGGIRSVSSINARVATVVSDLQSSNDNAAAGGTIAGDSIVFNEGAGDPDGPATATLTTGSYYLEEIDFSGGSTIDVDTSGGPVTIAVRDYVELGSGDQFNVFGDNVVRVYVRGANPLSIDGQDEMVVIDGGDVTVANDDAPELRFYGRDDLNVTIAGDGTFTGAIYAPPGAGGTSNLTIDRGALFGGAVVADTVIETQGSIHYDEALRNTQIISRNAKVVKITFLHVTRNAVEIRG